MRCWRRIKKALWIYRVKDEVLRIFQEEKNTLLTIKRRKVKWICRMLRMNCLLHHFIEGEMESTGRRRRRLRRRKRRIRRRRRGIRCKEILDSLKN
jgi:hypothetical protein